MPPSRVWGKPMRTPSMASVWFPSTVARHWFRPGATSRMFVSVCVAAHSLVSVDELGVVADEVGAVEVVAWSSGVVGSGEPPRVWA